MCKERLWKYHVQPGGGVPVWSEEHTQEFEYLAKIAGYDSGYALVCEKCWDEHLSTFPFTDERLPEV